MAEADRVGEFKEVAGLVTYDPVVRFGGAARLSRRAALQLQGRQASGGAAGAHPADVVALATMSPGSGRPLGDQPLDAVLVEQAVGRAADRRIVIGAKRRGATPRAGS